MQKRAINVVLTSITGTALAGMLVAGVAAASDDGAPTEQQMLLSKQVTSSQEHKTPAAGKGSAKPEADKPAPSAGDKAEKKSDAAKDEKEDDVLLSGETTASYFWDDGSGVRGDTGAPASGEPMQKGMFASPSWPMMTKVKVSYNGRSVTGFVGDRGPGEPSHRGIMLDLDTYTFRYLLDGEKPESKYVAGTGQGHIEGLKWEVLEWGDGGGERGKPQPFGS
ncbi:RlpA-like double-psi beta-barrel domain-containing protein [Actinomadura algeriensis]|uniref:Lipoprotein n=1 Tax=Actinomadura algeriensis TaxID=1679523 RepID=A0ABR9JZA8_9ACTN|nr:hypothetical protein [Actinomadura algeriensis]MBE1535681.1 hypothetical protein [Actinomadura algeriensis]